MMPSFNANGWKVTPLGDCALQLRAECGIAPAISQRIHQLARLIHGLPLPGLLAVVPAFDTLTLRFSAHCNLSAMRLRMLELLQHARADVASAEQPSNAIEIVVEAEFGPDLANLAEQLGCSQAAALAGFCAPEYLVAQIGFQPGFPYLLGLPAAFAMPRRSEPRARVRAGSIAIGGAQAGIYPGTSPGGWNIIGYTEQTLFNPQAQVPCLLRAGDRVRFVQ